MTSRHFPKRSLIRFVAWLPMRSLSDLGSGLPTVIRIKVFYRRTDELEAALLRYHLATTEASPLDVGKSSLNGNQLDLIPIEDGNGPDSH